MDSISDKYPWPQGCGLFINIFADIYFFTIFVPVVIRTIF